jgi:serine/threonine protein kinase
MILAGELASREMVLRFRAEAESAANLRHPNIVAIYETGEVEGQHYFSMEHVDGADLGRITAKGPFPTRWLAGRFRRHRWFGQGLGPRGRHAAHSARGAWQ